MSSRRPALREMSDTVERATQLANQMLSLAKVEQLRQQGDAPLTDWAEMARAVALDLAPLIAAAAARLRHRHHARAGAAPTSGRLRELTRNLLHNAIKHCGAGRRLQVRLRTDASARARLTVADSGPGIADELRQRLFQPFASGDPRSGSGLGLAICHDIVLALGGEHPARQPLAAGPGGGPGRERRPERWRTLSSR